MSPLIADDSGAEFGTSVPLQADTEEQFLDLLRHLQIASGRTAGQIAAYSRGVLPRSTAYRFVSPTNHAMPKFAEQVRVFARCCGLTPQGVHRVVFLWEKLTYSSIPTSDVVRNLDLVRISSEDVVDAELVPLTGSEVARRALATVRPLRGDDIARSTNPGRNVSTTSHDGQDGLGADKVIVHGDVHIKYHHTETTHETNNTTTRTGSTTDPDAEARTPSAELVAAPVDEQATQTGALQFVMTVLREPRMFYYCLVAILVFTVAMLAVFVAIGMLFPDRMTALATVAISTTIVARVFRHRARRARRR